MSPATDLDDAPTVIAPGDPLLDGVRLRDYEIRGLVREGRFAIVYVAWDHSLQRQVAVKEYLPAALAARVGDSTAVGVRSERHQAAFEAGLHGFVEEARLLARFDHPSLVKVYRFWAENGTAYMVMPFYEGPTLKTALAGLGHVPGEAELRAWLRPVLNAVAVLHESAVVHQNIGPDNIVLSPTGPVLLGLSGAGRAIEALVPATRRAFKPGFAAIEQYGTDAATQVGPWTDLYALASVVYFAVTGAEPPAATARIALDTVQPLAHIATGLYSDGFVAAIDAAMVVRSSARPADHLQFRALMGDIDAPDAPVSLAPRLDLMQEPFIGTASSHREITVPDRPLLVPTRPDPPPAAAMSSAVSLAAVTFTQAGTAADPARTSPSWMGGGEGRRAGRRTLYGVVAVTCVGIGAAAFALNTYLRPSGRSAVPPTGASAVVSTAASARPPAASQAALPVQRASTPASPVATASPSLAASVALAVSTVVVAAPASVPAPAVPTAAAATASVPSGTPAERQARCIDILQKASLERINPADTDFFKKECK